MYYGPIDHTSFRFSNIQHNWGASLWAKLAFLRWTTLVKVLQSNFKDQQVVIDALELYYLWLTEKC